uniref:Uncharacterized protein n=1 Tax=Timema bartmani TaxID=61472 RepID=A0A7R9F689_9NEOP|nr:unnamed protein product [Timema bartmani]
MFMCLLKCLITSTKVVTLSCTPRTA